jgi:DNA-binding response OmpR family regulator
MFAVSIKCDDMRILVIEDERKVAEFVGRGLRDQRFAVDVSNDGQTGWEMASSCQYDLVVLDLMLPGLSGLEVLKRIRRAGSQTPVLVLTARAGTAEKVENFEAGADDYLTKPFAFDELLVRVKALLRRGSPDRASILRIADLEIDRQKQQARRAGKRIELTPKEYSLLEYLAANQGRVLSRTMIIEHVWDESFQGLTNIVDVYVRHLRSKVDDPNPKKLIRTVRGVGYSISEEGDT